MSYLLGKQSKTNKSKKGKKGRINPEDVDSEINLSNYNYEPDYFIDSEAARNIM